MESDEQKRRAEAVLGTDLFRYDGEEKVAIVEDCGDLVVQVNEYGAWIEAHLPRDQVRSLRDALTKWLGDGIEIKLGNPIVTTTLSARPTQLPPVVGKAEWQGVFAHRVMCGGKPLRQATCYRQNEDGVTIREATIAEDVEFLYCDDCHQARVTVRRGDDEVHSLHGGGMDVLDVMERSLQRRLTS